MPLSIDTVTQQLQRISAMLNQYLAEEADFRELLMMVCYYGALTPILLKQKNYLPKEEFDYFSYQIDSLAHQFEGQIPHALLLDLLKAYLPLLDQFYRRELISEEEVMQRLRKFSTSFQDHSFSEKLLTTPEVLNISMLIRDQICQSIVETNKSKGDLVPLFADSCLSSDTELKAYFGQLLGAFRHQDNHQPAFHQLREIFKQADEVNYLLLVSSFLSAYQEACPKPESNKCFTDRSRNNKHMLINFAEYCFVICEFIGLDELKSLIDDSDFRLEDPKIYETETAFSVYQTSHQILFGDTLSKPCTPNNENQYFLSLFAVCAFLGRQAAADVSPQLLQGEGEVLLPSLYHLLGDFPVAERGAFNQLIASMLKSNRVASEGHKRLLGLFLISQHHKLAQVTTITGYRGLKHLCSMLGSSLTALDRFLSSQAELTEPLITLMRDYAAIAELQETLSDKHTWLKLMTICTLFLMLYERVFDDDTISGVNELEDCFHRLKTDQQGQYVTVDKLLFNVSKQLIDTIFKQQSLAISERQVEQLYQRFTPQEFVQLIIAYQEMEYSDYESVFVDFLKCDLLGDDADKLLHDVSQNSNALSMHNKKIRRLLNTNSLDPEQALSYRPKLELIIRPADTAVESMSNPYPVLINYLSELKEAQESYFKLLLLSAEPSQRKKLNACQQRLDDNIRTVTRLSKREGYCKNNKFHHGLEAIDQVIAQLSVENLLNNDGSDAGRCFWEFADHFIHHYGAMSQQPLSSRKKRLRKTFHFTIEQWPKERDKTFFLGDHVGCCLSTTSSQFPAMVQRRMDDAMLFHVATDQDSGKPAALIWLYLAEKDSKVCLVANFFEANAKYAVEPELRRSLLNGLLKFTEQYCQDNPTIEGFYMNKLTYGWNKGDLDDYPSVDCRMDDKLGGPLELESRYSWSHRKRSTAESYYLTSLQSGQFHHFSSEILAKNISNNPCLEFSMTNSTAAEENTSSCTATYRAV